MSSPLLPSMPYQGLVLHIGLPKTGTTTLQTLLFANHSGIGYLGRKRGFPGELDCRSKETYELLRPLLWEVDKPFDPSGIRRKIDALSQEFDRSKVLVGSWEGLSNALLTEHREILRRLVETFGGCRLLICLRNPVRLMPSIYLQSLRGRSQVNNRQLLGSHWYLDIDQWMTNWRERGGFSRILSYAERIRISVEVLGSENVQVQLFEDLCEEQDHFIRSICKFLEVDESEGLHHVQGGHLHRRMPVGHIEFLKRVALSYIYRGWLNRKKQKRQRQILDEHGGDEVPARVELPPHWISVVADATREGNRWLRDHYQLDLEKYEYPL
ncbi:MAG: sulfotransferase [Pirellulaceae bacterium]